MERLPDACLQLIASFLLPSEQDKVVDIGLLTLDQIKRCISCNVHAAEWYGRCHECHLFRICPECGSIPNSGHRYDQLVGFNKRIPNVCKDCYDQGVPNFTCFFCSDLFFALDGHRIVIECDSHPYEQVICPHCIDKAFSLERWNGQWVIISIRPSAYGAKLWYGSPLSVPMFDFFGINQGQLNYRTDIINYMKQSKSPF